MKFIIRLLCCFLVVFLQTQPANANIHFLSISDIHYGSDNTPGDGHDADPQLFATSMKKFSELANQADFMMTLGDFPTHMLVTSPKTNVYIKTVFHALYQADKVKKPLFYITGNNDSLSGNYQPFSSNGESVLALAPEWQGACAHCNDLIIDKTHMLENGYYSTYVIPGNKDIILIALNSIQFTKRPFFTYNYPDQDKDAQQQLQWLETQLKTHHAKQLLIAMHVPPGNDHKGHPYWYDQYLKQFTNILSHVHSQYGQISLLTSHSHMADIRKLPLENGMNIYAYATASISRIHHNNPAMAMFALNTDMQLKDYTVYYSTKDSEWKNEHYQAIQGNDSMFPQCHGLILAKCLDGLSNDDVCKRLQEGQFYGAKSPRVDGSVCGVTYPVMTESMIRLDVSH